MQWSDHDRDELPADALRTVDDGLGAANEAAAPLHEVRQLGCFARDDGGHVIGGAVGRRWGVCVELQQLWVAPAHRRAGLGAALVRRFEAQAIGHGCTLAYLETFSFQAPKLYRALGYEAIAQIEGFAPAIVKLVMTHRLV